MTLDEVVSILRETMFTAHSLRGVGPDALPHMRDEFASERMPTYVSPRLRLRIVDPKARGALRKVRSTYTWQRSPKP